MNVAKGLSIGLGIPLLGINHIQAHIAALFIENETIELPCLVLLVNGGHTMSVAESVWVMFALYFIAVVAVFF